MFVTNHAPYFRINNQQQHVPEAISRTVAGVINSSWIFIKPLIDPIMNRFFGVELEKLLIEPMFTEFNVQELFSVFFKMNSNPKNV